MASNPFRKSRPEDRILALDSLDTSPAPTPPPPVSFKTQISPPPPPPRSESPLPPAISTTESKERRRKSNAGKKVRVLSPPQSPDDGEGGAQMMGAAWPFNVPGGVMQQPRIQHQSQQILLGGEKTYVFPSVEDFERDGPGDSAAQNAAQQQPPLQEALEPQTTGSGPPPNPFNKTLHDLENAKQKEEELHHQEELEGAALKAGNLAKGSLDVDAFRRLLMTGKPHDGTASPAPSRSQIVEDLAGEVPPDGLSSASSTSESSSATGSPFVRPLENGALGRSGLAVEVTREDLNDEGARKREEEKREGEQEDSGDESESSVSVQIGTKGKKPPPPPPSSRHGRSILSKPEGSWTSSDKDVNKPLPAAPMAGADEPESPFDREAAGKVPEVEPSREDPQGSTSPLTTPKKPVPAPPPRRGHARTDTKTVPPAALSPGKEDDTPPRSSMESHTSVTKTEPPSSTLKPVPAPPPPRRPQGGSRSGNSAPPPPTSVGTSSPALSPSTEPESLHEGEQQVGQQQPSGKGPTGPPPPPPARHGSTRRPQSFHAPAQDGKRVTPEGTAKAQQKLGVPPPPPPRQRGSSKGSVDGHAARGVAAQHVQAQQDDREDGKGGNILADLEALQREVDAMRGKLG